MNITHAPEVAGYLFSKEYIVIQLHLEDSPQARKHQA